MINKAKNDFNYEFDDHEVDIKVCVTFAGRGGHFVLVKTLIEKLKGGLDDIMIKDMLMFACESGNTDLIEYVLGQGSDDYEQGFINACACGNISVIDFMFELYVMTLSDTNNLNFDLKSVRCISILAVFLFLYRNANSAANLQSHSPLSSINFNIQILS